MPPSPTDLQEHAVNVQAWLRSEYRLAASRAAELRKLLGIAQKTCHHCGTPQP